MRFDLLVLPGDGIGIEVVGAALDVLGAIQPDIEGEFDVEMDLIHGASWDVHGTFCTDEVSEKAARADAVLVGAVGGPKWDSLQIDGSPEDKDGLMRLRKELDVFAGLRPARTYEPLRGMVPFRPEVVDGVDLLVLREMCGGAFFGHPRGQTGSGSARTGYDTTTYSFGEVARFADVGFRLAQKRKRHVLSVDKSNVMESGVVWRAAVDEVGTGYPDVDLIHMYADNAAYQLTMRPGEFDVVLSDNLFGDILSDQAAAVCGSLGMLPSACLSGLESGAVAIYEPVHGSAPDLAGLGIANPLGAVLSLAMMFEYSVGDRVSARRLECAVVEAIRSGCRTPDLGGDATTEQMVQAVVTAWNSIEE